MTDKTVDLGQIRGDWDFHARYVANAMEQTLKRVNKSWRNLKRAAPTAGQVPVSGAVMDEFIEACRQTRAWSARTWRPQRPSRTGPRVESPCSHAS